MKDFPSLQNWLDAGKYFEYKGHKVFYRESGSGPTLLLIHGFPTASWDWYKIWGPLTERFHVIAPDMMGFGFSAKPFSYTYSLMDQANLHETMMAQMGVSSVHILAHDYGDTVAQELLARWLERKENNLAQVFEIQSVTLLNGGIFPGQHRPRIIQKLLASPLGWMLVPFLGKLQLGKTFREIFGKNTQPTDAEIADFWQLIACHNGKRLMPKLIRYMKERVVFKDRWVGAIQKCPLPLCHINGADDPISGKHVAAYFKKIAPQAEVYLLEGVGHYPQVEAPGLMLEYFYRFKQM